MGITELLSEIAFSYTVSFYSLSKNMFHKYFFN